MVLRKSMEGLLPGDTMAVHGKGTLGTGGIQKHMGRLHENGTLTLFSKHLITCILSYPMYGLIFVASYIRIFNNFSFDHLGLKVIGGKMTMGGYLGAFITKVKRGSIAETVGRLRAGEWQIYSK